MLEAELLHLRDAGTLDIEFGRGLGDLDLAVGFEAAIVVDQRLDAMPDLHRHDRQRNFGDVPAEATHAASIDTRGMATGVILLDQQRLDATHSQVQCRRAALDATADDDDVGLRPGGRTHNRTTALRAASVCGKAASSASVIGFTGGRRR